MLSKLRIASRNNKFGNYLNVLQNRSLRTFHSENMMNAIVRSDLSGGDIELKSVPIPEAGENEVLIKVDSSPINPSDLGFLKGVYGDETTRVKPPSILGFEGSGTVVEVGKGVYDNFIGKQVSFIGNCHSADYHGCWADYTVKPVSNIIVLKEGISLEAGSMLRVNPITAMGFYHIVKQENHKAVIHTAASSACGKMFIKIMQEKKIKTINIVRRSGSVAMLKEMGAEYTLDYTSDRFESDLRVLVNHLKQTVCFDAVGGELGGTILSDMPHHSILYSYGSLGGTELKMISSNDLRFKSKKISGFWIGPVMRSITPLQRKEYFDYIFHDLLKQHGFIFNTNVAARFPLHQWRAALEAYLNLASEGKILLQPNKP